MKSFLIEFRAEYYCQGFEWGTFTVLVQEARNFKHACDQIKTTGSAHYECNTARDFKNYTI
jgi:hypothetical protein